MNIVLFGAGPHVACCIDIIEREGKFKIVGLVDSIKDIGTEISGYRVIGRQEFITDLIDEYKIDGGIITIGDNFSRKLVNDQILNSVPDFHFVNAIHPSTIIGKNVSIGKGIVTMGGVIISTNSIVSDFCLFNAGAQLEHDSFIGKYASISVGSITGGKVTIGKYAAINIGVTVLDRIQIGENSVIGAGSLVLNDIPDNVLAYGCPAKIVRGRKLGEKFLKS